MKNVDSSNLHSVGWDRASKTMSVRFKGKDGPGKLYTYANVPETKFNALLNAKSVGGHFNQHFRGNSDHPHTLVDEEKKDA